MPALLIGSPVEVVFELERLTCALRRFFYDRPRRLAASCGAGGATAVPRERHDTRRKQA
jgi:hypothetical protein